MRRIQKRIFDFVLSFVGILVFSPIMLIVFLLIKIIMPGGPVFFIQERIGQFGCSFKVIKFRTMVPVHSGISISVKGESRITPFGAILRKYKIDELPELVNVLLGQMSFVGPRPDVPGFADELQGENRKILELKPGITGPATIQYINEEEILASVDDPISYNREVIYPEKVKINLDYYYNNSLLGDLKILLHTFFNKHYLN